MKNFLIAILCLAPILAFAQGSTPTQPSIALNAAGVPVPSAIVAICTSQPTTTLPCGGSSLLQTSTTAALSVNCALNPGTPANLNGTGCTNPGTADGFGNVVAFASPGAYWCQFYGSHIVGVQVFPCPFPNFSTAVISVFGRNGVVTAQSGDYSVGQVTGAAPLAGPNFTGTVGMVNLNLSGTVSVPNQSVALSALGGGVNGDCIVATGTLWGAGGCGSASPINYAYDSTPHTAHGNGSNNVGSQSFGAGIFNRLNLGIHAVSYGTATTSLASDNFQISYLFGNPADFNLTAGANATIASGATVFWRVDDDCFVSTAGAAGMWSCVEYATISNSAGVVLASSINIAYPVGPTAINLTGATTQGNFYSFVSNSVSSTVVRDFLSVVPTN